MNTDTSNVTTPEEMTITHKKRRFVSEEARRKMSEASKGRKKDPEHVRKIVESKAKKRARNDNTGHNFYLQLLQLVNEHNLDIIPRTGKHTSHYSNAYKPASDINRYVLHTNLTKHNIIIPYHHRPRCRLCKHFYYPAYEKDSLCDQCAYVENRRVSKQRLSLAPVDLLELGFSYSRALKELGYPQDKRLWTVLDDWNERNEDESIAVLEAVLTDILGGERDDL